MASNEIELGWKRSSPGQQNEGPDTKEAYRALGPKALTVTGLGQGLRSALAKVSGIDQPGRFIWQLVGVLDT